MGALLALLEAETERSPPCTQVQDTGIKVTRRLLVVISVLLSESVSPSLRCPVEQEGVGVVLTVLFLSGQSACYPALRP